VARTGLETGGWQERNGSPVSSLSYLILENGSVYPGRGFGSPAPLPSELKDGVAGYAITGEVVFNTAMSGYHEALTDPSYTGQILAMCYPHMGNYGTSADWNESGPETGRDQVRGIKAAGLVVRSVYDGPVPEGRVSLHDFLAGNGIPGITEVDTRKLTLELRDTGSKRGVIVRSDAGAFDAATVKKVVGYLKSLPSMEGCNLITDVGATGTLKLQQSAAFGGTHHPDRTLTPEELAGIKPGLKVALYDCGAKANILRELQGFGCEVTVYPSSATAAELLSGQPDGVLVSNGPGDPAVLSHQIKVIQDLFGKTTVTGICLGHQLIALALGAATYKMKFGHHGINHPVRDELTKKVFVTSQNHGFAVDERTLPGDVQVWFRNANDHTVEGIQSTQRRIYSAQFHPESAPGPYDSLWIFGAYLRGMSAK
jgi:carbamoyl-phosphate synthase small subunit